MSMIFNKEKALEMVDNDTELLDILLQTFIETEFSLEKLNSLISSGNLSEAASYTHRVKGAGRQLSMEKIAESGQNLEDVLRGKKEGNISSLIKIFYSDYLEGLEEAKKESEN